MAIDAEHALMLYKDLCEAQTKQLGELRQTVAELTKQLGELQRAAGSTGEQSPDIYEAQKQLVNRCKGQIFWLKHTKTPDPKTLIVDYASREPRLQELPKELRLEHLHWMIRTMQDHGRGYPSDKLGRWIGFVQAGCVLHGVTSVDAERDWSRSILHAAYVASGLRIPETRDPQVET